MPLHPLAERFATVADSYERGRPDYPPAVTDVLAAELRLAPGARVLDLAAGTGKLSRALLAAGLDVITVEPHAALREVLAGHVGAERVLDGRAEQIPLASGSVAAVTVADAFHWFDRQAALAEIRRVLVPGGGLAVLASVPSWRGASWAHELGTLMFARRPEHLHFDGPPWQAEAAPATEEARQRILATFWDMLGEQAIADITLDHDLATTHLVPDLVKPVGRALDPDTARIVSAQAENVADRDPLSVCLQLKLSDFRHRLPGQTRGNQRR